MHTENTIIIHGKKERIFALAADVMAWPHFLPHYRNVTLKEGSRQGLRKVVEMAAWRDDFPVPGVRFPVRWRSVQLCEPDLGRISFKHLAGIAVGMWVVWILQPLEGGEKTQVTIRHDLTYPFAVLNGWFAQQLVGRLFVQAIAGRTLQTIKSKVESEAVHE
jgi:ribosome-associated toxin RatA of RatAB toxin-antitoxin module